MAYPNHEKQPPAEPGEAAVAVSGLYKVFGGDVRQALDLLEQGRSKDEIFAATGMTVGVCGAGFAVAPGEIFVIMGLSGSGKSTLLRMINRLVEPSAGRIVLKGEDVTAMTRRDLVRLRRRETAMVFQSFALMDHLRVWENAAFGLDVAGVPRPQRRRRAMETLEQVGLKAYADSYPAQLSGGMRQRVGLARALAVDPSLMLMDEAFSALDPLIRTEMQDELVRLQRGSRRSVIFISHDLNEAMRIGDRIAIMQDGRIVQLDTPKAILRGPANDFVRSFFRGVDLTEAYQAGDVARRDGFVVTDEGADPRALLARLRGAEHPVAYICAGDGSYRGAVTLSALMQAVDAGTGLGEAMTPLAAVQASDSLNAVIRAAAGSDLPVPVTGGGGAFAGAVSQARLLQTLNQEGP